MGCLKYVGSKQGSAAAVFQSGYYAVVFACFFYICANPFIYAVKFDPVKRVLLGLVPCKKTAVAVDDVTTETYYCGHLA